jgi:hypothetical protein
LGAEWHGNKPANLIQTAADFDAANFPATKMQDFGALSLRRAERKGLFRACETTTLPTACAIHHE